MDNVHPLDLLAAEHSQLSLLRFNGDDDDIDCMTIVGVAGAGDGDWDDGQQVTEYMKAIQNLMWKYAGILRNDKGLKKGLKKVRQLRSELQEQVEKSESCKCVKHAELMNMVDVAELVLIGQEREKRVLDCTSMLTDPKGMPVMQRMQMQPLSISALRRR